MKLNEDFVLRQVAGNWIVMPVGEATVNFNGMLALNETGAFIWQNLKQGHTLDRIADLLTAEYDVKREQALLDIDQFIKKLTDAGCLEI